jgi:hypothetical protein
MLGALLLPLLLQVRIDENQSRRVGEYRVVSSWPKDPGVRQLGGSGGPLQTILVVHPTSGRVIEFTEQAIWIDAMAMRTGPPVIFVWTKSSIDAFSRCRMEPRRRTYVMTVCEDYERNLEGVLARTKTPPRRVP